MEAICSFRIEGTIVANEFIDRYMAAASGEYVKVYLYLLRHQPNQMEVNQIADALDYTESDVKRALAYWEKAGILQQKKDLAPSPTVSISALPEPAALTGPEEPDCRKAPPAAPALDPAATGLSDAAAHSLSKRPLYSQEQVNRLADDEDFSQLLYIAQKYMDKVFTPRECEVFAYLYDGLGMAVELLEYLVEFCVQSGHSNIRYIETVGLNWHERGFATADEARSFADSFIKGSYAVMRCFGLTDRKPGDAEKRMMEKWFSVYGFSRELVLEACNRTMEATHTPSFRYADKILAEWKKGGVKTLQDVMKLDEEHRGKKAPKAVKKPAPANPFHNFEQRDTDYDSMVLNQVKSWIGQP
ncbi:MAG: DnaD domain protein [Lachnospiraceae bacterium]|nr:DnaD domain protein [Lachnospiraceae bacterium]